MNSIHIITQEKGSKSLLKEVKTENQMKKSKTNKNYRDVFPSHALWTPDNGSCI